jgi:hypothetical protein
MPRIVLALAEWQAIARELAADHTEAPPPGLAERVAGLLAQAPEGWPDQPYALELDEAAAAAVRDLRAAISGRDPDAWQRAASVAEAVEIVRDHQRRP